jgi:hypothetical protein
VIVSRVSAVSRVSRVVDKRTKRLSARDLSRVSRVPSRARAYTRVRGPGRADPRGPAYAYTRARAFALITPDTLDKVIEKKRLQLSRVRRQRRGWIANEGREVR